MPSNTYAALLGFGCRSNSWGKWLEQEYGSPFCKAMLLLPQASIASKTIPKPLGSKFIIATNQEQRLAFIYLSLCKKYSLSFCMKFGGVSGVKFFGLKAFGCNQYARKAHMLCGIQTAPLRRHTNSCSSEVCFGKERTSFLAPSIPCNVFSSAWGYVRIDV